MNPKRFRCAFLFFLIEDRVDGSPEQTSDLKRERQRGIMLSVLNGIHRLARNSEPLTQLSLTP
jgi:hypothetical protein